MRSAYSYLCYIPDFGRVRSIYPNAAAPHKPPFDMTEFGLIDTIRDMFAAIPRNGFDGIGDDCTVFPLGSGESLVFTADLLAENIHFLRRATSARELGRKSLAVNLSDVAAMGARPIATLLSLAIPHDLPEGWIEDFMEATAKPEEKPDDNNNNNNAQPETPQEPQGGGESLAGGVTNTDPITSGGGSGGGTSTASVPRVIVTGFNTDPGDVNAGSNFKLIIHLKNTSSTTAVSNMLFDLQAPASGTDAAAEAPAFLPASGSSSIYLDGIPAGGTKDISIDLNARADLVQKPYSIAMSMKYEDGNATQFESASSLAIPVKQAARFELSDIEVAPESVAVGEEANITCSLYNTGRIKLYNVKAKFEGEGLTGKEVFVGNIEPGATGSIDGIVTANQEMDETKKCKVVISYEDEAGKSASMEKEFPLTVTPAQNPADMMPMEAEAPEKGLPVVPIVIAVVVVAGIVTVVLLRRHKKKKMAALEEEDLLNEVDRFTEDE